MKDRTTIYFVRHGEVYNPKKVLYGRLSGFPLSDTGKKQIIKIAQKLAQKNISFLYSSPLLRAKQTAQIFSQYIGIKPKISKLITEVNIVFEGVGLDIYRKKLQKHMYDEKYIKRGQENIDTIAKRMLKFIISVKKNQSGKTGVVVSHGDPILILKAETTNQPFTYEYKIKNYKKTGEYLILECNGDEYRWF